MGKKRERIGALQQLRRHGQASGVELRAFEDGFVVAH